MPDQELREFIEQQTKTYLPPYKRGTGGIWKSLSPQRRTIIERSFRDSFAVFEAFYQKVFEVSVKGERYGHREPSPPVAALLQFPSKLGADPTDERTVQWAAEFFRHRNHAWGNSDEARAAAQQRIFRDAAKLYKAGVPLDYLREFHPADSAGPIPMDAVIWGWKNGLSPEYAREVLGA